MKTVFLQHNFHKQSRLIMKTLILGIGSPFADDQFGWHVARKIKAILPNNKTIDIEIADRPGLNLLHYLDLDYQKIILIDAVSAEASPGTEFMLSAEEICQFNGFLSSHNVGVAPSLALARALGNSIAHIVFFGVQAKRFNAKDDVLSPEVQNQIVPIADKVLETL